MIIYGIIGYPYLVRQTELSCYHVLSSYSSALIIPIR